MKTLSLNLVLALMATGLLLLSSCNKNGIEEPILQDEVKVSPESESNEVIPDHYLITLKESFIAPATSYVNGEFTDREKKAAFLNEKSVVIIEEIKNFLNEMKIDESQVSDFYSIASAGFAAKLTEDQFEQLSRSNNIAALENDLMVQMPDFEVESVDEVGSRFQITPCNITAASGPGVQTAGKWIWIIDTGIDTDHPDLNVLSTAPFAKAFTGGTVEDCNGHGTHVAGTAAAINNSIGVVGMAPGARVVPVRVFGCSGGSPTSRIISALEHVARYDIRGDVVNMSLGGYFGANCATGSSYFNVLQGLSNNGTFVASAAGNSNANAALYQPACINGTNLFTVGAYACNNTWYSNTNYGIPPVDFVAVGVRVYSTYKNGRYATLTGTSMATPCVAGILNDRQAAPATGGFLYKAPFFYRKAKK